MKNLILITLFLTFNVYSQSYSEKWNNLENRYEYFNSQGYLVGYKSYDNINRQWNYYNVSQQSSYDYKPTSSVNLPLVQQVLASKQSAYNQNSQRITNAVNEMRNWLNNSTIDENTKFYIRHSFNKFHLEPMYAKGYDFSDTAFVNQIIQSLYNKFNERVTFYVEENKKQAYKKLSEPKIGTYYTLSRKATIWDRPNMGTAESIGEMETFEVYILEKTSDMFYKVRSGNIIGYITAVNFK